jgi:fatty acid desaturase/membrane-associated phospholipid phosphatase
MNLAREKAVVSATLGTITAALYFGTLHIPLFAAPVVAPTAVDAAIPFVPLFVVPYLSFFLLVLFPLLVISDLRELWDVAFGFGMIVVMSSLTFLFWPTAIPFSDIHPLTRGVVAMDLHGNAFPSLHASLALYCALCARRKLQTALARYSLFLWTSLVVVSALLIKRHLAVDIAGGALLGWATRATLFRPDRAEPPDSEPVVETLRIRRHLAREASNEFAAFTRYDGRKRATELAVFLALAGLGFWVSIHARSVASAPMLTVGILVTAVALNTFPLLMHEGMHGVLFASRRWNWIASVLLGSTFLMSFSAYRVLHLRHHRYLGDARDPDDYHNYSRSRPMVWCLHFVRLTFGPLLYVCLIPVLALKHGSSAQRKLTCIEYTLLASIYSVLLRVFSYRDLFAVWFVPLLLMGALTAIRGFTQHGITEASDPYLASRTMLPSPMVTFFLLNENYHLEHHLFPEVPSYHLPALHELIWPKLPRAVSGTSYLAFLAAFLRATPRMDETPIGLVTPAERAS